MEYDIVIIGGGMAGLSASIYLADLGIKTAVITKGDPICGVSTGCIDVLSPGSLKGLNNLPPEHPYHIVGEDNIRESLSYFQNVLNKSSLTYVGDTESTRKIITPIGERRTTALVPASMAEAEIRNDEDFHLVSFSSIKDFYPSYITGKFPKAEASIFEDPEHTTLGLAAKMDETTFLENFIKWINGRKIAQKKVGVPGVLGIADHMNVIDTLNRETGKTFFEIPTLPPSIPGLRLSRKIIKIAKQKGVHIYQNSGTMHHTVQNGLINEIVLKTSGRNSVVSGKAFILATGSFVSGGLFSDQNEIKEIVFDLPVYTPKDEPQFNTEFFKIGHPIEKSGILIDNSFRPKEAAFKNLFIAGSIIAHGEIMKYQCGHGLAISTGISAAKSCRDYTG